MLTRLTARRLPRRKTAVLAMDAEDAMAKDIVARADRSIEARASCDGGSVQKPQKYHLVKMGLPRRVLWRIARPRKTQGKRLLPMGRDEEATTPAERGRGATLARAAHASPLERDLSFPSP